MRVTKNLMELSMVRVDLKSKTNIFTQDLLKMVNSKVKESLLFSMKAHTPVHLKMTSFRESVSLLL